MVRILEPIDICIRRDFVQLTQIEEMLLAVCLPVMSVFRLVNGHTIKRCFCVNLKQDSIDFVKSIPRDPSSLPLVVIKPRGRTIHLLSLKSTEKDLSDALLICWKTMNVTNNLKFSLMNQIWHQFQLIDHWSLYIKEIKIWEAPEMKSLI